MTDPVYDPIAAFAATLAGHGVTDVVISPGSRSAPLSIAFHARPDLRTTVHLDERSAGFFALGQARATGRPSVLICTSGSAAANYLPAVVEANYAGLPLIVCTADRPPELRQWGAGQTIDQIGIYGSNTRWFADVPVPSDWTQAAASMAAMRAFDMATGPRRGPVHLNWPLREPLEPISDVPVPAAITPRSSEHAVFQLAQDPLGELTEFEKGIIIVGPDVAPGVEEQHKISDWILRFAESVAWPVFAEPLTQLRRGHHYGEEYVMNAVDHLCKHSTVDSLRPDVVVRLGASPTTKPVRQWLERVQPEHVVLIDQEHRWHDASFTATEHHGVSPVTALGRARRLGNGVRNRSAWLDDWWSLDDKASTVVDRIIEEGPRLSARVTREFVDALPDEAIVMTSNSMPVRDLDSFLANGGLNATFVGNRGASGIDGIISTGLGLASCQDGPVVVYTGDLALLHDLTGLASAARLGLRLTIVCIDNDGGGIFSMLPIAEGDRGIDVETLFRTPHGIDLTGLDGFAGIRASTIDGDADIGDAVKAAIASDKLGVNLLIVPVDRDADVAQRRAITAAVGEALAQ
ncbi:MAG: 2-succinyl-5-enolpyruvyl-6-hydroxy-3-cyclohexene-1-carboxylic-acid synthase [Acidimicrobiaceae bacterium]|jgi:2-succinyl-5-enolpyruvyl-6-hydroxy-3-cyclohexene-1-carboxylate synthase|nr:2-succinyl-5-enolpyruvyl-6-hydroxy-3-cyclohexene-1-carboxylic-acid synthase [Acidimicrobiaceae bacterium]MBT5581902.1 2-succinyl-5-enolpyruvyl-6-hydroxy-3-cyclohexene-1-carboxylic-acid synthase [Acidimicrobiaceae bacterium]